MTTTNRSEAARKAWATRRVNAETSGSLSTMTPAEIDALIFPLWAARWTAASRVVDYRRNIALTIWPEAGERDRRGRRERSYYGSWDLPKLFAQLAVQEEKLAQLNAELAPLEAEYDRRAWNRFTLVGKGHLHKPGCHTLRPTTQRFLLAESSGMNDDEVVGRYSYTACTHCFPDAPVAEVVEDGRCAGSGQYVPLDAEPRRRTRYVDCPSCGKIVARTRNGYVPKHKPEEG